MVPWAAGETPETVGGTVPPASSVGTARENAYLSWGENTWHWTVAVLMAATIFFLWWLWELVKYSTSVSTWMEGRGSSCCSTRPRYSRSYRVVWPVGTLRHWPVCNLWSEVACSTSVPVGGSYWYCRTPARGGLKGILPF